MCAICGQPGYVRCNCQSAQPFCDQCDSNSVCVEKVDSSCVIYHFTIPGHTPPPTRLINLGMPNGSSAEAIFEKIDQFLGLGNKPWVPGNTPTINLSLDNTVNPSVLKGVVNISTTAGNILTSDSHGLFVPALNESGKVRVSQIDPLLYLEDSMFGGTDGCVSLDISRDATSGRLFLQPSISAQCLFQNLLNVEDTSSIHLNLDISGTPVLLSAAAKISATAGNILTVNADGLYVPTPGAAGLTAASNGLSVTGGNTVILGGNLTQNTTIGFNTGAQYLRFNSTPQIVIGEGTPTLTGLLEIQNTYASGFNLNAGMSITTTTALRSSGGGIGAYNNVIFTGGTDTDHSVKAGTYGQIFFNASVTLNSANPEAGYAGIHGIIVPNGTGTVLSGTAIPAGIMGGVFASDDATLTSIAAIRARGAYQSPGGAAYTGTITNYYGLHIEDIAASGLGGHMTNKFAIFQVGTGDISRFFGPVQNAGGTTQFTSDVRVKENVETFTRGLSDIEKIDTHTFNYTYNKDRKVTGIIAQEIEQVIPEAVHQESFALPNGEVIEDFRIVDQNVLFYAMVNAIKELSAQNKVLKERLDAIKIY